jgi:hypothetical protein
MAQTQRASLIRDLDGKLENLKYKKPSKTKAKTQVVYFNYGAQNLRVQLATKEDPPIHAPFGVSKFVAEDASEEDRKKAENDPRQQCDLSLNNSETLKFFQDLDEHNVAMAIANKATWWPSKKDAMKDDVIRSNYKPCVVIEESYAPRLRAKVNMNTVKVLDFIPPTGPTDAGSYRPGSIENWRKKPFDCIPICEPNSIWFMSGSWGCTIMVTDLLIFPPIQRPEFGFAWGDDENAPKNINDVPKVEVPPSRKRVHEEVDGDEGHGEDEGNQTPEGN